jgi:hypothetical protein
MKKAVFVSLALATTALTKDFFPLAIGDAWDFTYNSRSGQVSPDAPITLDSGTVRWEVMYGVGNSAYMFMYMLEKRNLVRHNQVLKSQIIFDSLFSPPRVTLDTIVFKEGVSLVDTGRIRDSIINAVSFSTASCPVAVHDPSKPVPAELGIKNTSVEYKGSTLACIITTPSYCSSVGTTAWSFILADSIGPVEIEISPNAPGADYYEKRYLLSREYRVPAVNRPGAGRKADGITVVFHAGNIRLIQPRGPTPVSGVLYNASGRKVRTFSEISSGTGTWNTKLLPHGVYLLDCKTGAGTFAKPLFLRN